MLIFMEKSLAEKSVNNFVNVDEALIAISFEYTPCERFL